MRIHYTRCIMIIIIGSELSYSSPNKMTDIYINGGAYDVMIIIIKNGHGDTSSNPRQGYCISHSTWEKYESNYSPSSNGLIVG